MFIYQLHLAFCLYTAQLVKTYSDAAHQNKWTDVITKLQTWPGCWKAGLR